MKRVITYGHFVFAFCMSMTATANDEFSACGPTEAQARAGLLKNISSSVSAVDENITRHSCDSNSRWKIWLGQQNCNTEEIIESRVKVEAGLSALSGVKIAKSGSQYCGSISKAVLIDQAKSAREVVHNYRLEQLPENYRQRLREVTKRLEQIDVIMAVTLLYSEDMADFDSRQSESLDRVYKELLDERAKLEQGKVRFSVAGPAKAVVLDGETIANPDELRSLLPGKHSYTVVHEDGCDYHGVFTTQTGDEQVIAVDMNKQAYPTITLRNDQGATASLNGTRIVLNEETVHKQCDGDVSWQIDYSGQAADSPKSGRFTLEPGKHYSKRVEFVTTSDIEDLKKLVDNLGRRVNLQANYVHLVPGSRLPASFESQRGMELSWNEYKDGFYWGVNLLYAKDNTEQDPRGESWEMAGKLGLQFLGYGADDKPFHVGSAFTVVPYVELQLGVGHHDFAGADEFYPEKRAASANRQDHGVVRLGAGFKIPLSNTFALQTGYSYNFFMDESHYIQVGFVALLPEDWRVF